MKKLLFILVALLSLSSCKKDVDGCMDSTATNYDSDATVDDGSCLYATPDYTCDGHETNNDYIPLINGADWLYKQGTYNYTETINGTEVIGTNTYHKIDWTGFDGSTSGNKYYRKDSNGDIVENRSGTEYMIVPGNPTVGQQWQDWGGVTYTVISLSASVSAQSCSYTGCLHVQSNGAIQINLYYKRGVGLVKSTDYSLVSLDF